MSDNPIVQSDEPPRRNWRLLEKFGKMTPAEWHLVPSNPRQRDTELHARRARERHLKDYDPTHQVVRMALIVDTGEKVKLDGHTRDLMWHEGVLEEPRVLMVETWKVDTEEDAKELYTRFDNANAAETTGDRVGGAVRENGLFFISSLMKERRFGGGLILAHQALYGRPAYHRDRLYAIVFDWRDELMMLDSVRPTHYRFIAPLTACALLLLRAYGKEAMVFLDAWQQNSGNKSGNEMDAIQAFDAFVNPMRHNSKKPRERSTLMRAMLAAYQAYISGTPYKVTGQSSTSLRPVSDQGWRGWLTTIGAGKEEGAK